RQELAQEAELGHGQETTEEDGDGEDEVVVVHEAEISKWEQDHTWYQEQPNQRLAGQKNQEDREQDAAEETADFLPALDVAAPLLEHLFRSGLPLFGLIECRLRQSDLSPCLIELDLRRGEFLSGGRLLLGLVRLGHGGLGFTHRGSGLLHLQSRCG